MEILQFLSDDIMHITLIGQLWQMEELCALENAVDSCIQQQHKYILLDLQRLSFINSQGLGLLVRVHKNIMATGGCLILACYPSSVLDAIEISGFREFMKIAGSEAELQQILSEVTGNATF